jgi:hypothetical protein
VYHLTAKGAFSVGLDDVELSNDYLSKQPATKSQVDVLVNSSFATFGLIRRKGASDVRKGVKCDPYRTPQRLVTAEIDRLESKVIELVVASHVATLPAIADSSRASAITIRLASGSQGKRSLKHFRWHFP